MRKRGFSCCQYHTETVLLFYGTTGLIRFETRFSLRSAAVTCAILGPAGPQRSRILANLYRDDRCTNSLPPHRSSILRKMFLDQILRSEEVQEFQKELAPHQLAELEVDKRLLASTEGEVAVTGRRAPKTVLDRAVMEHNVLACAKVSNAVVQERIVIVLVS
jgi:COP9 signalosome complex subunit 4